jgi:flagellar hook-associated protein 1 FlgK
MSNWFAGLGQAASGMNAARYGLSVVGQNIANANSDGYTRQVTVQQSVSAQAANGLYTRPANDGVGGVEVTGTQRVDDALLDARVRTEHGKGQFATTSADQLSGLEQLFPVASDDSLSSQLTAFWSDWSTVANNPGNSGARPVLLQDAGTVVGTLHNLSAGLDDLTQSATSYLGQDVDAANSAATQLASVNRLISVASTTGGDVNALFDQRDQLLDQLSKLTGSAATINANGTADVTVAGQALVTGTTTATMTVDSAAQVSVGGTAVTLSAGSAAARVSMLQTTLPKYRSQLDGVADALSTAVNSIQTSGFDLNGNPGAAMFSGSGAGGITVALTDPARIAASATAGGNLDGSNAQLAARLGTAPSSADSAYSSLVGALGAESQAAQSASSTQQALVDNVDAMHASVSGVNYDEEVSNMLTYQRAFQASSRALTTMDDMLDTLINHTGRAGLA